MKKKKPTNVEEFNRGIVGILKTLLGVEEILAVREKKIPM